MSENPKNEDNLAEEVRTLAQNLIAALQAAWDSPERKQFTEEMVKGMDELQSTIRQEAEKLSASESAQKFKDDVEEMGEKLRSSETQNKIRQELLTALQTANSELQKVIDRWSSTENKPPSNTP
jgi:DNA-binding transcriptional regulator GbsR (MarR family)